MVFKLLFAALKLSVLNTYCKSGEAITVLNVTLGYSEVCVKAQVELMDRCVFQHKETSRPPAMGNVI